MFIACACSLLFSCQHSPTKNYFYLTALLGTEKASDANQANITQVIGIGPVEVADYLTRSQIIDSQTDNKLNMSENAYWAETLDKSIARTTALNLTQANNSRSFVTFPWRSDSKPRYSLRLRIDNLSRSDTKANINATWELVNNDTKANLIRRNFIRTIPTLSGAKALAQSYSQLLADLAAEIDVELNKLI
jgi:uncharacterized lipoprotein YmbA